uniref:Secreted protein n=1 Tax=Physcomitrium patens TaxID=3218 RepID=A0A2K1J7U4_PHYPA|nr:hypothetical protein PHYPA_020705 [Physcomitrium patens]
MVVVFVFVLVCIATFNAPPVFRYNCARRVCLLACDTEESHRQSTAPHRLRFSLL